VHWQTGAALLLPRLLAGRREGPVFLTMRKAARPVAGGDLCPVTGRARLSYRRAEESFELATRPLASPGATREELKNAHGWTLHQLRHSLLTHEAEDGTSTPMLLARSRHASVRSLERYARPRGRRPARRPFRPRSTATPVTTRWVTTRSGTRPACREPGNQGPAVHDRLLVAAADPPDGGRTGLLLSHLGERLGEGEAHSPST
jgi:hypothetical protein